MTGYVYKGPHREGLPDLETLCEMTRRVREEAEAGKGAYVPPCGTRSAYRLHRRHGEEPCDACANWRRDETELRRGQRHQKRSRGRQDVAA